MSEKLTREEWVKLENVRVPDLAKEPVETANLVVRLYGHIKAQDKEVIEKDKRIKDLEDKIELTAECAGCSTSEPQCKDCYIVTGKKQNKSPKFTGDGPMSEDQKNELEVFKELWYNALGPTVWCMIYQHPLHRACPVILNYENLPEPFNNAIEEPHEGKTGDRVHLTPEKCFECENNIRNGGICDPI